MRWERDDEIEEERAGMGIFVFTSRGLQGGYHFAGFVFGIAKNREAYQGRLALGRSCISLGGSEAKSFKTEGGIVIITQG
jgi:hypothetical protein